MKLRKAMALVLAGAMTLAMTMTASAATELSFWTLQGRSDAYDPLTEQFNEEIMTPTESRMPARWPLPLIHFPPCGSTGAGALASSM